MIDHVVFIMDPRELAANFIKARKIISDLFDVDWLESDTGNQLQKIWKRTDWVNSKKLSLFPESNSLLLL